MEKTVKRIRMIGHARWLSIAFAIIMADVVASGFGPAAGFFMGLAAAGGFLLVIRNGQKNVLCDGVLEDLRNSLSYLGGKDTVLEIMPLGKDIVIRVYFVSGKGHAREMGARIINHISRSWYSRKVAVTQIVDIKNRNELKQARRILNREIVEHFRDGRD